MVDRFTRSPLPEDLNRLRDLLKAALDHIHGNGISETVVRDELRKWRAYQSMRTLYHYVTDKHRSKYLDARLVYLATQVTETLQWAPYIAALDDEFYRQDLKKISKKRTLTMYRKGRIRAKLRALRKDSNQ